MRCVVRWGAVAVVLGACRGSTPLPPATLDVGVVAPVDATAEDVFEAGVADAPVAVPPDVATPDAGTADAGAPDAVAIDVPSTLHVLFVGNSYTYVNDLPAHLAAMGALGPTALSVDSVTVGGATLHNHWDTGTAPARITAGGWDAVVLQEQSVNPALDPADFSTYATRFATLATMHGARPVFYATWPRRAGDAVYAETWSGGTPAAFGARLDAAYTSAAASVPGSVVAHVGVAWMAALAAVPAVNLYADDGSHPSPAGTWLAACVMYRALTRALPTPAMDVTAAGVAPADARALRELAAAQAP